MNGERDALHVDLLLPGYVLGALDADEEREVKTHLRRCPRCWREADRDRAVAAQIGFAAPRHKPPPHVKHRLMARVVREGMRSPDGHRGAVDTLGAAPGLWQGAPASRPPASASVQSRPARWLVAAAALPWLVAAVLGVLLALSLHRQAPSIVVAQVGGVGGARAAYGWLTMAPDGTTARLVLTHMPPLAPDERYVCWLENGTRIDRACVFRPSPGRDVLNVPVSAPQPMSGYARLTVTVEKGQPSPRRTGTLLAYGSLR